LSLHQFGVELEVMLYLLHDIYMNFIDRLCHIWACCNRSK